MAACVDRRARHDDAGFCARRCRFGDGLLQAGEVPVRRDAGEVVTRSAVGILRLQYVFGFGDETQYRSFGQHHVVWRDAGLPRVEHLAIDDSAHGVGEARGIRAGLGSDDGRAFAAKLIGPVY